MIESGEMDFESRIVAPECIESDNDADFSLRPKSFSDYIGQDKVKENLKIYIEAAKKRREHLDHVLLYGPPGLGKTTLANIIASELGVNIHTTSGPAIEKPGDLAAILTTLEKNDVLFIDEIHRLSKQVEEILYPAMEDLAIDIILEKGLGARSVRLDIQPFTLVGATTRAGQLSPPLRDRFGVLLHMEPYSDDQLAQIITRNAITLGIGCDAAGALELARRARGTPRIANRLLKRVRDFAEIIGDGIITSEIADVALTKLEIDKLGLDSLDRKLLRMMINSYNGGPVGLDTLAAAIGEEAVTIEDVCEPYLMQLGFLKRTPKGRCVTAQAYAHLGLHIPDSMAGQMTFDA